MKRVEKAVDYDLMEVSSPSFKEGEKIPPQYTCDGKNVNPPIDIENIPAEAKCLALIVEDPDAPRGTWIHWLVWNIPVTHHITENKVHGIEGLNDFKQQQYRGPCPPSGSHRYYFKVYALAALLDLPPTTGKVELEKAMSEHILGFGELMGVYPGNS